MLPRPLRELDEAMACAGAAPPRSTHSANETDRAAAAAARDRESLFAPFFTTKPSGRDRALEPPRIVPTRRRLYYAPNPTAPAFSFNLRSRGEVS